MPSQSQVPRNTRSRRAEPDAEESLDSSTESYFSESDETDFLDTSTTRQGATTRDQNSRRPKNHAKKRRRAATPSESSDDEPVLRRRRKARHPQADVADPAVPDVSHPDDNCASLESQHFLPQRLHQGRIPSHNHACFKVACVFVKALIFTQSPWPTEVIKGRLTTRAWDKALDYRRAEYRRNGFASHSLTESSSPDRVTAALLSAEISKARGRMVYAARQLVSSLYDLSPTNQSPADVRAKGARLLDRLGFLATWTVDPATGIQQPAYFTNNGLWEFMTQFLFTGYGKAARHPATQDLFMPRLSPVLICLAATALYCAIQGLTSVGVVSKAASYFEECEYGLVYTRIFETWQKLPGLRKKALGCVWEAKCKALCADSARVEIEGEGTGTEFATTVEDLATLLPPGMSTGDLMRDLGPEFDRVDVVPPLRHNNSGRGLMSTESNNTFGCAPQNRSSSLPPAFECAPPNRSSSPPPIPGPPPPPSNILDSDFPPAQPRSAPLLESTTSTTEL